MPWASGHQLPAAAAVSADAMKPSTEFSCLQITACCKCSAFLMCMTATGNRAVALPGRLWEQAKGTERKRTRTKTERAGGNFLLRLLVFYCRHNKSPQT